MSFFGLSSLCNAGMFSVASPKAIFPSIYARRHKEVGVAITDLTDSHL